MILALVACGEESNVSNVTNEASGVESVSSVDSNGTCDSSAVGMVQTTSSSFEFISSSSLNSSSSQIKKYKDINISYGKMIDARNGQTYRTVVVGEQIWMAENLNYDYNQNTAKSYCYDNETANCIRYGRLYTWTAAMDSAAIFSNDGKGCGNGKECTVPGIVRGVCPAGWHLPDSTEWSVLIKFVADSLYNGKTDSVGYALKSTGSWKEADGKKVGSDVFGFGALPSGNGSDGKFYNELYYASFWSSTEYSTVGAYYWYVYMWNPYYVGSGLEGGADFHTARSIRCIKNSQEQSFSSSSFEFISSSSLNSSSSQIEKYRNDFISYGKMIDARDGQAYKTFAIGEQVWMAENLNYDYNKGTAKSYCYGNDTANCIRYGRLYTWAAAMDSVKTGCGQGKVCSLSLLKVDVDSIQGVCPDGWHLPCYAEWINLEKFILEEYLSLSITNSGAEVLKARSGWTEYDGKTGGDDRLGFGALPAGIFSGYEGKFLGMFDNAYFWSSSEDDWLYAHYLSLSYRSANFTYSLTGQYLTLYITGKDNALSVRCVKDWP